MKPVVSSLTLVGLMMATGIGCSSGTTDPQACSLGTIGTLAQAIVNGADEESYLLLGPRESEAIVSLLEPSTGTAAEPGSEPSDYTPVCSGVAVAERWVVTAKHCTEDALFLARGDYIFEQGKVEVHPSVDLALVEFPSLCEALPTLPVHPRPLALAAGDRVVASGFGVTETGTSGKRQYLVRSIRDVSDDATAVEGYPATGACFGDSGGPLLSRGDSGRVELVGTLSAGSESCTGTDLYVPLTPHLSWIQEHIALPDSFARDCGGVSSEGHCFEGRAVWCEDGVLRGASCDHGESCGWSDRVAGYRCISMAASPPSCLGDTRGHCRGDIAEHCERGLARSEDCASGGRRCLYDPAHGGAVCVP